MVSTAGGRRSSGEEKEVAPSASEMGVRWRIWEVKSNRPYLYPRDMDTTGTTGGKALVLPVRLTVADRRCEEMNYRWFIGTTG
jgi:hypothetical protein